jgi:hypothetical protein
LITWLLLVAAVGVEKVLTLVQVAVVALAAC